MNGYEPEHRATQHIAVVLAAAAGAVLLMILAAGCATYTEHFMSTSIMPGGITNISKYKRQIADVGTGKRTFAVGTNGAVLTHSEIAETLDAAGRLAGTIGAAVATSGGSAATAKVKDAVGK